MILKPYYQIQSHARIIIVPVHNIYLLLSLHLRTDFYLHPIPVNATDVVLAVVAINYNTISVTSATLI